MSEPTVASYTVGGMGEPVLEPLLASLMDVAGRNRIEPARYRRLANGSFEVEVDRPRAYGMMAGVSFRTRPTRSRVSAKLR